MPAAMPSPISRNRIVTSFGILDGRPETDDAGGPGDAKGPRQRVADDDHHQRAGHAQQHLRLFHRAVQGAVTGYAPLHGRDDEAHQAGRDEFQDLHHGREMPRGQARGAALRRIRELRRHLRRLALVPGNPDVEPTKAAASTTTRRPGHGPPRQRALRRVVERPEALQHGSSRDSLNTSMTRGGTSARRNDPPSRWAVLWARTMARTPALSMMPTCFRSATMCGWPAPEERLHRCSNSSADPPATRSSRGESTSRPRVSCSASPMPLLSAQCAAD